jgi:hypothetical protein
MQPLHNAEQSQRRRILVPTGLAPLGETKLPVARDHALAFGADVLARLGRRTRRLGRGSAGRQQPGEATRIRPDT